MFCPYKKELFIKICSCFDRIRILQCKYFFNNSFDRRRAVITEARSKRFRKKVGTDFRFFDGK